MQKKAESFSDLIAPLPVEEFLAHYWEKTYLHQSKGADRFADYFSISDMDQWLSSVRSGLSDSIVIAAPEGAEARRTAYRPGDFSVELAYLALARGSSIILNHLEDWPTIAGLSKALARDFHAEIGVNAYCTPKQGRTFPIHTDEHDVLVLHLAGEKVWRLHEFSLLQLRLPQKKNLSFPEDWYGRTQTPLLSEVRLRPGDLLYIPRGMPHCALAQESTCLHLTISITTLYWMDFLKLAVEDATTHSQALRSALPPGFVESETVCERMRETFSQVLAAFQREVSFERTLAVARRDRARLQHFPADGHLAHMSELEGLSADTEVERRRDVLCVVDDTFDVDRTPKVALYFANQRVAAPPRVRRSLEFIRETPRFRVRDIPGLDENGQLVLVRRLLLEGLLRPVAQTTPAPVLEPALT
jgi:hypothetical protein